MKVVFWCIFLVFSGPQNTPQNIPRILSRNQNTKKSRKIYEIPPAFVYFSCFGFGRGFGVYFGVCFGDQMGCWSLHGAQEIANQWALSSFPVILGFFLLPCVLLKDKGQVIRIRSSYGLDMEQFKRFWLFGLDDSTGQTVLLLCCSCNFKRRARTLEVNPITPTFQFFCRLISSRLHLPLGPLGLHFIILLSGNNSRNCFILVYIKKILAGFFLVICRICIS